jgi:hypothetical protein
MESKTTSQEYGTMIVYHIVKFTYNKATTTYTYIFCYTVSSLLCGHIYVCIDYFTWDVLIDLVF